MIWCREPGDADRFMRALAPEQATVVAPFGDQIVMLVPLPPGSGPETLEEVPRAGADPKSAYAFADRLRDAQPVLESDRSRIRRIEELTGRDLSRLDDQVDFFLALRIR